MQLILMACLLAAAATATATKDFIISKVSPLVMTQCAKEGRLLKSIDFDWSWKESATADLSSCLSLSSDDSGRHLIAGTMKQGVYISHDVGSSWQLVNLPKAEEWISASSDALGENLAVLSRQGGLFHSNDHGLTWKKISTPQIENWTGITCDQTGQYLALTSVNDGIFTSFDYGLNWVNSDGTNKIRDCADVAIDVTGQYLVAVTSGGGIYHSMDHGLSWNLASLPEATASQTFKRIVSDRTGQFLVALPDHGPLLTSRDYGKSWSEAPSIPFTAGEVTHLAFDSAGNELFAVAENGAIYSSNDKGITWSTRVKTVALDQPNNALSSNAFDELFTGYKDFFPKIEKSSLVNVEQESSDQFKELYDTYQNFLSNPELTITSPPTEAPSAAPSQPSSAPTSEPSHSPTSKPSRFPSSQPTSKPSHFPSSQPTSKPSHFPSAQPTSSPTTQPTVKPSSQPSSIPTKGSYASTVSFTLTQTLNGIDATTFTSNEGIESAFQSTVQSFLSVPQLVDEVSSVVISSVVNRATASISLEATGIIDVATINTVTLTKWVAADVAFTSLQKIYAKNVTSGAVTAAFRSLAGDLVSDVSIAAPSFGAANVVTVDTPVPSSQPTSQPSRQPSAKPSSQPSSVPTSRPSRDLTKVVPTFTLTKSATTRSSATLTLTFTGETVYYSGTLFCAAYTATTITSSNYFTRLNLDGVTASYSAGAQSVKVTLTGLIPSTSYTAYCLVENIVGRYSAFTQVTQNALTFSSDCCKALSFTTAPSFIVNDYTLYTTTTYSGKNVYSFSLDYLPSTGTTLVVQPTVTGAASNIIFKFSPSSFSFTSSSTSLKASFSLVTLNTTSTTTGTVLTLATTGTAASQYNRTSVSFSTIAADQVPAPTLQSAVISNAVSSLSITFSGSTDYGGKSASTLFSCSDLLTFSFFTTTGQSDSSSCLWTSASNLVAYLSTTTFVNIVVNSGGNLNKLTLLASKVKAQCNTAECRSAYTPKTTINITSPVNPPLPTVALSVPAVLAGCSNLTIDATASLGSFGRAWTSAKYVISSPNVAVDQINSVLSNVKDTTSVITLPSSSFAATSYYVTLTLTNIFGKTSSLTVPFSKSSSVNIPSASIAGATKVSILSKNSLSLTAVGSLSPCGDSDLALTYKWLVLDSQGSVLSVNSTSKVASTLILPAYSLKSGALYTALVTVRAYNSKLVNMGSANASVSVQVKSGSVIGKISGSHNRFISQDTVLDASSSYDEDVLKGSALKFKWSCISLEVLTYGDDCSSTALASLNTTAKSLTVPFSNLALGTSYSFQIVVSSSDGRSGSDAVTVKTTSVASQAISALIGISTSASTATTISRFQPINIQAFVTATVKTATPQSILAKWTGYFTDEANTFQVSNYSSLTTVSTVFNLTTTKSLSSYPFPLPIKASSFQPGTTATFRLTLSTSGTTLSYNEISYSIVTNPTGGQLSISPASGISLSDVFTVRAIDWIDDSDYLPLSYDFKYTATDGSVPTLQSQSQLNFVQSVLPAGSGSSDGGNVTVVARVFNIYGGYSSVKSNVFVSSDPNAAKNAASFLETSLANAKAAGNSDAVVSLISVTSSVLNTVNCSLVSETFCANEYNREACKSTPQTCGSCLDGYNGVYGDSNTKCTSSSRRFLAASTSCQSNSDCFYGNCNVTTKECVVPTKTCPSQCSDNGVCSYSDVNGHELSATECTVENTYCIASCSCNTGFYGQDCSLSAEDYASKEKARLVMCTNLIYAISISNPSSSLIDSLSTALNGAYDPYEVISSAGRAECLTLLEGIVALADAGYLTSSQLPSDSSSSSAVQSLLDTASNFVKIGDSSSLSDIIATLTNAVMGLLVNGEQDIQLISSNLKLSFNKIQFINVFNTQFTIPTTAEESNYGAVTPVIEFTDEDPNSVINACSEFSSSQSAQSNEANPYNYFSLAYGSWGANPFSDAENFQSVLIRTQAFTNNTVSSENSDSPLYLITYPFTSTQQLTDLSGLTKEERRLFNQTFPVCSEYFLQELNQSYLPALCSSCNVSTYDNTSVTFACYNMKSLCGSASASSTTSNVVYQSLKEFGADRRRLAESESISVSQMGATVKKSISVSTTSFNYNQFNVDLNAAIPILISIASIVIIIVIGIVYFYLWDINDYYLVKYSNRLRNRYTSMIFSNQGNPALLSEAKSTEIEDKQPGVFPQTYFDEGEDEQETLPRVGNRLNRPSKVSFAAKKISSTQRRGSGLTRTSTEFEMNIGTSQNDILYILHNAFPAVVYDGNQAQGEAAATTEQKTLNKKSRTASLRDVLSAAGKSFYEAMVTNNDYVSLFNSSNFYYYRLVKWMQIMIQVITILFINTLFFYIFYPDRGQCQDYRSAGDCLYHKNLITQEYLCQWSSSGNLVQQDVSCELRPPELNLPFIMLLSTVTILVAMPVVLGWNTLLINLCASVPPVWYTYLLGDSSDEVQQQRPVAARDLKSRSYDASESRRNRKVATQPPEDADEVQIRAAKSIDAYDVSRFSERVVRKPLNAIEEEEEEGKDDVVANRDFEQARMILYYINQVSANDEVDILLQSILNLCELDDRQQKKMNFATRNAKFQFIHSVLGIDSNFHTTPLSLRQQLKYTNPLSMNRSHTIEGTSYGNEDTRMTISINDAQYRRIWQKLNRTHKESDEIIDFFRRQDTDEREAMRELKEEQDTEVKDILSRKREHVLLKNVQVLQFFTFEQFPMYQKYLLFYFFHHTYMYSNLHLFNSLPAELRKSHNSPLNMIAWILKALVLLGGLVYSVYFILNWSVVSQGNTFASWGLNYIIIIVEQLIMVQWIQYFYLQKIITTLLLPKLQLIYSTVYQKLVQMMLTSSPSNGRRNSAFNLYSASLESLGLSQVWPGMSYYTSSGDTHGKSLFGRGNTAMKDGSETEMRDELPLWQFLSPVARACKSNPLEKKLVIGRMVNAMSDYEMMRLKSQLSSDFSAETISNESADISRSKSSGRLFSTSYDLSGSPTSALALLRSRSNDLGASRDQFEEGREQKTRSSFQNQSNDWKQYSLFHLLFIMLPLFIIQSTFQTIFAVLPFLSSSFYTKNFILNSFHMIYLNMLFSYVAPGLISLFVIVCYYFCISVPLPAFIIVTIVVLSAVFLLTPKRNEQFWQAIGVLPASSTSPRHFTDSHQGGWLSSLMERTISLLLSPFSRSGSTPGSSYLGEQQWQRQNLPMALQPAVMSPDMSFSSDSPPYESVLMTLVASQEERDSYPSTGLGKDMMFTIPPEIHKMSPNAFAVRTREESRVTSTSSAFREYLSTLLLEDQESSRSVASTPRKFKDQIEDHPLYRRQQRLFAPDTTPPTKEGKAVGDKGKEEEQENSRSVAITSVDQLRSVVEIVINSSLTSDASSVSAAPRYYNLFHRKTDDVQLALLRAFTIRSLNVFFQQGGNDAHLVENLQMIYSASELVFDSNADDEALTKEGEYYHLSFDINEYQDILQQFFVIFLPVLATGSPLIMSQGLTEAERIEITQEFFQFLLSNDYPLSEIPFILFVKWFRAIMEKTVKYKLILQFGARADLRDDLSFSRSRSKSNSYDEVEAFEGKSLRRKRFQYQMSYERLQRVVTTDAVEKALEKSPKSFYDPDTDSGSLKSYPQVDDDVSRL